MLKPFEDRHVGLDLADSRKVPLSTFRKLRAIYKMVVDAPATTSPEALRRLSCEAFVELFEGTDYQMCSCTRGQRIESDDSVAGHRSGHVLSQVRRVSQLNSVGGL